MSTTRAQMGHKPHKPPGEKPDCGCGGKKAAPGQRVRECVPCDLDRFCRNHYFTGKLLTARDLLVEQRYLRDKLRLHHRVLHGWGVACGLRVVPHPHCPDLRVIVEPGVAIDACGHEIVVDSPGTKWICRSHPSGGDRPSPVLPTKRIRTMDTSTTGIRTSRAAPTATTSRSTATRSTVIRTTTATTTRRASRAIHRLTAFR